MSKHGRRYNTDIKNETCRAFGLVGQLRKRSEETEGSCQAKSIFVHVQSFRAEGLMMPAKFRVKRSATGLGLFATEPIGANCFIVRYWGKRISNRSAGQLKSRYLFELNRRWTIDGSNRRNLARYLNHSCKPNAVATITDGRIEISTKKKIDVGEEITINYGADDFDTFIKPSGCKCAACVQQPHRDGVSSHGR